jgi:triacylglycerol lipase
MKIVLAHGLLGFGSGLVPFGVGYFNGVKGVLEQQGHEVFAPSVAPLGSLAVRSEQLARQIEAHWPGESELAVIAHSMGGIDARRVIHRDRAVGKRIKCLITIATPHFGSPVADAVLGGSSRLLPHIPRWLLKALKNNAGALPDLKTRQELHDPDCDGVTYLEVACVNKDESWFAASPLFGLSRAMGAIYGPNDGLVPYQSACHASRQPIAEWSADHGDAIGWPSGYAGLKGVAAAWSPPDYHLQRYLALAQHLAAGTKLPEISARDPTVAGR